MKSSPLAKSSRTFRRVPGSQSVGLSSASPLRMRQRPIALAVIGLLLGFGRVPTAEGEAGSDRFFDPSVLQTIYLEIGAEDLERMQRALPRRIWVPGTFGWNDRPAVRVGIRYKGNSSSQPSRPFKRSFLISFGEFDAGQRFLGLRHVALDNGIQFGGLFSEPLISEILRGAGVTASRCNYARVYLNGKPMGVYVNVERIDRSFLARHYASDRGPLFKVDEGGPGADFQIIGGALPPTGRRLNCTQATMPRPIKLSWSSSAPSMTPPSRSPNSNGGWTWRPS